MIVLRSKLFGNARNRALKKAWELKNAKQLVRGAGKGMTKEEAIGTSRIMNRAGIKGDNVMFNRNVNEFNKSKELYLRNKQPQSLNQKINAKKAGDTFKNKEISKWGGGRNQITKVHSHGFNSKSTSETRVI